MGPMPKRPVKTVGAAFAPTASSVPKPAADAAPTSIADSIENRVSGQGTWSDKRTFADYRPVFPMTEVQQAAMFRGSWLANRIVSTPAEDMTRGGWTTSWDKKDDKTTGAAVKAIEQRFDVQAKVFHGLLWARLTQGAAIVVGLRGEDLSTPLNLNTIKKDSLEILHLVDRWFIAPTGIPDRDLASPNYGLPEFYRVRDSSVTVHWSRVIRFEGRLIPADEFRRNGFWHDSELQHVVDSVKDYDSIKGGIASLMNEAKIDVIKTALAKMLAKKDGGKTVNDRYGEALTGKSLYRTLLIDEGEEYEQKVVNFANLPDVLASFVIDCCGAGEIPMLRLYGQSAPGMNATGEIDLRSYYDRISSQRNTKLLKPLMRLYDILMRSALGFMPENFTITFPPLWQPSAKEQSETNLNNAKADQIYLQEGVFGEGTAARALKIRGTYEGALTDEDVELAEELAQAPDPEPQPLDPVPAVPPKKGTPPALEPGDPANKKAA